MSMSMKTLSQIWVSLGGCWVVSLGVQALFSGSDNVRFVLHVFAARAAP